MKIWICGRCPRSGSPNAWKRFKNFNVVRLSNFWNIFRAIQMISCRARLVTMDETCLYHYDPETKQQSMEWCIAAHTAPKIPSAKIRWKISRLCFFRVKTASSSLIIFHRVKLSTRSINHLCWCNWRTFWTKNSAGSSPRGSCSGTTMPRLTGHLQTRRN